MLGRNAQLIMHDAAICLNVSSSCKRLGESAWLSAQHALAVFKRLHRNLHSNLHCTQIYNSTSYLVNNLLPCFMLN